MIDFINEKQQKGIYIHIPFCYKKCNYCDFYSLPSISLANDYVEALSRNIIQFKELCNGFTFDSVFIGGGTPSAISEYQIEKIINTLSNNFNISKDCEFSIEINPATVNESKLFTYKSIGINRISIGMQSTIDKELKILGRLHDYKEFLDTYNLVRKTGFKNINVDIMTGIPCQTLDSLEKTLKTVVELEPEHISAYMLKIEKGTPFYSMYDNLDLPDEDSVCDMYLMTEEILSDYGFERYEISNFSKPGFECKHNLKYWQGVPYIGFGPGAHSYFGGERYSYPTDIKKYISCIDFSQIKIDIQFINESEKNREKIIFGLRLKKGIHISDLENYNCQALIENYVKHGYCKLDNDILSLTTKGLLISNYLISNILLQEKSNDCIEC